MHKIYIDNSLYFSKYSNIVSFLSKQFEIVQFDDIDIIKSNITERDRIVTDKVCDINCKKYRSIIAVLKEILQSCKDIIQKMKILENIFKSVPCLIVSCGPSSNYDMDKIKRIQDRYVIIGVKYVRDRLLEAGIHIDITITSYWWNKDLKCSVINPNESDTISYHNTLARFIPQMKKDINVLPNSKFNHKMIFEGIQKYQNIDIIRTTPNRIKQNDIECPLAHIMLETALPAAIHIGCDEIYTLGWDGPQIVNGKKQYTYGGKTPIINNLGITMPTEYEHMQSIKQMFHKVGKQLYRVSDKSPIQLPLKELECV